MSRPLPRLLLAGLLLPALILAPASVTAGSEPALAPITQVDMNDLIDDTQKQMGDASTMDLVWWIPTTFWRVSMAASEASEAQISQVENVFAPYLIFAVCHGAIGPMGGVQWTDGAAIVSSATLVDASGRTWTPLPENDVNVDARMALSMMKPVLQSVAGAMGENIQFIFFQANDAKGRPLAAPTTAGGFTFKSMGLTYTWRLPLGSLLQPKTCPVDGERLSGAWSYCPWHGKELQVVK